MSHRAHLGSLLCVASGRDTSRSPSTLEGGRQPPARTGTDEPPALDKVWTSPLDFVDALDVSSPSAQTIQPPARRSGSVARSSSNKRIVYADDILTNSILPHMTGHRSFNASIHQGQDDGAVDTSDVALTQVTIVSPRPPSADWYGRQLQQSTNNPFSHLAVEDVAYACNVKHILTFPPLDVCDILMASFVRHFLPAYPVVDRMQLRDTYSNFRRGTILSPLLMHSIFFAACQYTPECTLQKAGFKKRSIAQRYFHSRATLLYSLNCEKDQLVLLQSLIFMSPWWTDYSEEKDIRFWTTCACNLAFSMGLHKAIPSTSTPPSQRRSLWRRIFWTLFIRDQNLAVGLARPPVINLDDVDVESLSETDFYESQYEGVEQGTDDCPVDFSFFNSIHSAFMMDLIMLSKIMSEVFKLRNAHRKCEGDLLPRLLSVKDRLEQSDLASERAFRLLQPSEDVSKQLIWPISAKLNRQRVVTLILRAIHRVMLEQNLEVTRDVTVQQIWEGIVRSAAKMMTLYEELLSSDLLKYGHSFFTLITYLEEVKNNPKDSRRTRIAVNKIQLGLLVLTEQRQYWNAARWAYSLFKFCLDRDFSFLRNLPRVSRWHSPEPGAETDAMPTSSAPVPLSAPIEGQTDTDEGQDDLIDFNLGEMPHWDASFYDSHQWFTDAFPVGLDQAWIYETTAAGKENREVHQADGHVAP
ncbi:hypothetical protein A1O7_08210 [Cladophialophora yegresii CBS 114405]|uniref:Xylanolytic transcriptional activator regulatory domain-containing protein n=1 Tax=Cladophialophora yegresii CBS 114405 TaxID=1182544 RepID=W9VIE3_9EURO|nr:uncharacterized protein A1O7_08210 [Cladophialophora yegresii CBS 114405]EXJ55283.1 hypothetical protein A1O7_08210 [Cladophialophora yegresii CBS 114405]